MRSGSLKSTLHDLQTLYSIGALGSRTDAELLELFVTRHETDAQDAFTALVYRHGPTVLGVCRRMLPSAHDCEDAFQATFLVLARRAASIGRREQLVNWLHGVAIRVAKESRRKTAQQKRIEGIRIGQPTTESTPMNERKDDLALLDEELHRLPTRYKIALIVCELEGKSRRAAAQQLAIPEGTLSAHLARARKLLRARLQRRGVALTPGPLIALSRITDATIPDRLLKLTINAAFSSISAPAASTTIAASVAALTERTLTMMCITRLATVITTSIAAIATAAALAIGVTFLAAAPPDPHAAKPSPGTLFGRVVNRLGKPVPNAEVWAMDGVLHQMRTVAYGTTNPEGLFPIRWTRDQLEQREFHLALFARAPDDSIGWIKNFRISNADGTSADIDLMPTAEVRGRLIDQNSRPIPNVEIAPVTISRSATSDTDYIWLSPEPAARLKTKTAPDGSFVLNGISQGAAIAVDVAAPQFGSPTINLDTTRPSTITLDNRLGRLQGRLELPGTAVLPRQYSLRLHTSPAQFDSAPYQIRSDKSATADTGGNFHFGNLPPGRYTLNAHFDQDGIVAINPQSQIEIPPGAPTTLQVPLLRLPKITGRVIDAQTGKGIADVSLTSVLQEKNTNLHVAEATTDAEGRYTIPARPGMIRIQLAAIPRSYIGSSYDRLPTLEVKSDQTCPDLKLVAATTLDGLVLDESAQPVPGAQVYVLASDLPGARAAGLVTTAADGTFHLDQLDSDDKLSIWARSGISTTDNAITIRPKDVNGKLTVTIDPKFSARIHGTATDSTGKRLPGAKVTLRWNRPYPSDNARMKGASTEMVLAETTTSKNGLFVFRNLWPGLMYKVFVEARGHQNVEAPRFIPKTGETLDLGKLALVSSGGHLAGRVIDSHGQPVPGAAVFNRGDSPQPVATTTNLQGHFQLDGLFPGPKYAFARKEGYRFSGLKSDGDSNSLTITLLQSTEPPPPWQSAPSPTFEEQQTFARQVLIRLWEKHGANAHNNGAFAAIGEMARVDPALALEWSATLGHHYDADIRATQARTLAHTDAPAALELLKKSPDADVQRALDQIANDFAETNPAKALTFAKQAAAQARALAQPNRTMAMANTGALLIKLGQTEAGRKLIDIAAIDAAQLPAVNFAGNCRLAAARVVAPYNLDRALALIEPWKTDKPDRWQASRARMAVAIATVDLQKALAMVETVAGNGFDHELAKTEIAYRIASNNPDAAIKIVEGIDRNRWAGEFQAGGFGWLAVAIAPRDPARAYQLIDRALSIMTDDRDQFTQGKEIAIAARIAICAQRIHYPDMQSVIMRVLATRPIDSPGFIGNRTELIQSIAEARHPLGTDRPRHCPHRPRATPIPRRARSR